MLKLQMKKSVSNTHEPFKNLLTRFLLVALFSCSVFVGASSQTRQAEEEAAPPSIGFAITPAREYALKTPPGQRAAGDTSKQDRSKHSVTYGGPVAREFGAPASILRQRRITTEQSVLYLSFRWSRPGGRAPPVSA
jgi:hypothetical protein